MYNIEKQERTFQEGTNSYLTDILRAQMFDLRLIQKSSIRFTSSSL